MEDCAHADKESMMKNIQQYFFMGFQTIFTVDFCRRTALRCQVASASRKSQVLSYGFKATITRCDLSPRFFCIDATLLCGFESHKI